MAFKYIGILIYEMDHDKFWWGIFLKKGNNETLLENS